jgi:hypothetical protein
MYHLKEFPRRMDVQVDADWACSALDRRSTSGGIICAGGAYVCSWARTQHVIALSSMESEYVAAVTGMQEGLYFQHMLEELGLTPLEPMRVMTDSSSVKAGLEKLGLAGSRAKHMDLRQAFAKDLVRAGVVSLHNWHCIECGRHADEAVGSTARAAMHGTVGMLARDVGE